MFHQLIADISKIAPANINHFAILFLLADTLLEMYYFKHDIIIWHMHVKPYEFG